MKKIKKLFCLMGISLLGTASFFAQVPQIVNDPVNGIPILSNWLTAIDTLYSNYDMVMNTITQIENQYKAINQAIENAKGIDWENIRFDGDFDIRDDIRDANKRVNRLLSQANAIKDTLSTSIISAGGISYSLADICGHGDDGKDFASCVTDVYGYMKGNMLQAAASAVGRLTEEQEKAIWQKYGISPRNYYLVAQASKLVREKASTCIAATTDEAREFIRNEKLAAMNVIVKAAMEAKTSDGTIPEGALQEASLLATQKMYDECISLREAVENAAAATAQKILAEEQQKEAEASEKLAEEKSSEILNNNVPAGFAAGRTKVKN
ncbi:MAG: hypothetical protein IJ688_14680 [Treponema sp.]|nr:hypothetical protein [Treponema sp.]